MFMRNIFRLVCTAVAVMVLLFMPATPNQPTSVSTGQMALALQAPPFVNVVYASEASQTAFDLGAYLDQEAGISAYYKSPDAITLNQVRSQFRTIETETADYIIGSVAVPNYLEHFDVHVYVHKTGWILAYYLRADPVSKIIDVKAHAINTTNLRTAVATIASAAGAPFTDVTYYDFRYPNATNMVLIAEDVYNGNSFTISLPSAYGYFERGWAVRDGYEADFWFDDVYRPNMVWCGDGSNTVCYGTLTASQVLPDVTHTAAVYWGTGEDAYGVLIIVYRVP